MSRNNDLISREAVIREILRFKGYLDEDMIFRINFAVNRITAADQPMSAVEYLYQRERMKAEMGFPFCIPDKEKIRACVAVVEKWVQEHPERSEE